jgi:hypothetical protein
MTEQIPCNHHVSDSGDWSVRAVLQMLHGSFAIPHQNEGCRENIQEQFDRHKCEPLTKSA